MFRLTYTLALTALAAFGSLTVAMAREPKAADGRAPTSTRGEKQITNSIDMKLTLVPSGEFMMGSAESAEQTAVFFKRYCDTQIMPVEYFANDHPPHRVRITKPFYLGTYPVTRGQFRQFVTDSGYKTDAEKGDKPGAWGLDPRTKKVHFRNDISWRKVGFPQTDEHPVVCVSWNDAVAFCKWLSKKEGKSYRLPTEAEWEYACRAGTTTRYYNGDDPTALSKVANVADAMFKVKFPNYDCTIKASDGYVFTSPVGQFKPNAFGLYDMLGNAVECCADWYSDNYYTESPVDDPKGPSTGDTHVTRGCGWSSPPWFTPSTERIGVPPSERVDNRGFRVASSQ